jgi:hypothetical protein
LFNLQRVPDKLDATKKAVLRALKLFCLGLVLQGTTRAATFFFSVKSNYGALLS